MWSEVGFQSFGKFPPGEHHTPPTAFAFEADVRAKTCDGPFVGTARMLFAQAQVIVELQVRQHDKVKTKRDYK
jgi:hypothetical protein